MKVTKISKSVDHLAGAFLATGLLAGTSTAALAQGAAANDNMFDMTYMGKDFGQTLKSHGVYFNLGYVQDFAADVAGGANRGQVFQGELFFGTDLDLQTILGIPSTSLHITFDARNGKNWNTLAGNTGYPYSNAYGPNDVIRLSQLEWDMDLADDHVRLLFGRTNPTTDFATSDVACQMVTTQFCAQPGAWYIDSPNPAYPRSTWGARVTIKPSQPTYFRVGVYEDDPETINNQGFDWSTTHATGVFIPAELGIQTNFATAPLPYHYNFGFWYDSTTTTGPGSAATGTAVPGHTTKAAYAQLQQTVFRPDPNTDQSLTLFGGVLANVGGPVFFQDEIYGGALVRGPLPTRPNDTFLVIANYENINKHQKDNLAQQLAAAYPGACPTPPTVAPPIFAVSADACKAYTAEWMFEINYGVHVAPGVTFKPFLDVVLHPDQGQIQYVQQLKLNIKPAYVIGAQLSINAAAALGLPHWVRTN
jgi:carbohydrate-selective porin OprB